MYTLMMSFGGDRYPAYPDLVHKAFGPSSRSLSGILMDADGGIVGAADHLDLFDDDRSWPDQLLVARTWLRERLNYGKMTGRPAENIVVHYVGHGWFKPNSDDHLLTINHTDRDDKAATSAALGALNDMLKREARSLRRFYLLDACFAAASVRDLMADHGEVIERQVGQILRVWPEEVATRGVAALCSADKSSIASAKGKDSLTQFTDGLLAVLGEGEASFGDDMSLRQVTLKLREVLEARYGEEMVHPVLVAPNDEGGGIAGVPLFPNPSRKGSVAAVVAKVAAFIVDVAGGRTSAETSSSAVAAPAPSAPVGTTEPGEGLELSLRAEIGDDGHHQNDAAQELDAALNEDPNFRTTMYRFFRLAPSQKTEIVGKLGLSEPRDQAMTELERYKSALKRARACGKTDSLEKLIGKAETGR
jgi:hypothetical protein